MNALKSHAAFLRPSSRPTSPAPPSPKPEHNATFDRVARPLNKLSLTSFRRASPAPQNGVHNTPSPTALVQDGSYLEMLSLKLSEAVTKALAQPAGPPVPAEQVLGRRPIPAGRGRIFGRLIASEIKAAQENANLFRAITRSLQRPLTVLMSTLSSQLSPLLSMPAVSSLPTVQTPQPNATQLHVIGIVTFAGELLETFDELGLGIDNDVRGDGLKAVRDGLVSILARGLNTVIPPIRNDLVPLLEALEASSTTQSSAKNGLGIKGQPPQQHPSIVVLQAIVPVYSKLLARYTTTVPAQKHLATFLITVVWRGLVALAHRKLPAEPTPPASPALNAVSSKKRRGSPSASSTTTPPMTPPPVLFNIKLPPSRPPSPPGPVYLCSTAADAKALYEILNHLPRPTGQSEEVRLACEAVDEAFDALKPMAKFLELLHTLGPLGLTRANPMLQKQLDEVTDDIPTLICLACFGMNVAQILGIDEKEYRAGCLPGFATANESGDVIAQQVLEYLVKKGEGNGALARWLEEELVSSDEEE